jgi:hypothetical protein
LFYHVEQISGAQSPAIETYRRIFGPDQTLLAQALREGSAELVAVLTTGRHLNPNGERYGLGARARALGQVL